ncbi:glycosyltransferase family 2 protein [uncultured Thiohalocapsa sp.]|uniref:glycosyltransferase n=1 Tax=uncultured Thiohalocapsa sp. TaxID=768990 RepID=UPI0025D1B43F|nr:glycosyltransferase family 2 protein [uncultured Thiohalocapsa sp.]
MCADTAVIGAIIVNYHTGQLLPALLDALAASPQVAETLIIDNSPDDAALVELAARPKVQVLAPGVNLGFATAVNQAAARLPLPWWLIINPDARPLPGSVAALLRAARRHDVLIVGPRAFWDDDCRWRLPPASGDSWWWQQGAGAAAAYRLDAQLLSFYWRLRHERFWSRSEPFAEPFLSGGCLLVRNDPAHFPGGRVFDQRFFLYYEDTDLCAGMLGDEQRMLCVPDASIVHYWDQSPRSAKTRYMADASNLFFDKHYEMQPPGGPLTDRDRPWPGEDLGTLSASPELACKGDAQRSGMQLEVGINPHLVPFVQRDFNPDASPFTPAHWRRLASGAYFAQLRVPDEPYPLQRWRWRKA